MHLFGQQNRAQQATNLEQGRESEIVGHQSFPLHSLIEIKGFLRHRSLAKTPNHCIPEKPIWVSDIFKNWNGVIHISALWISTKQYNSANDKEVLLKARLDNTSMDLVQIFHGRAFLEKGHKDMFITQRSGFGERICGWYGATQREETQPWGRQSQKKMGL